MQPFLYLLLVSSLACLIIGFAPGLGLVGGVIWGVALLLGGYWLNRPRLIILFIMNGLLLFGLSGSSNFFFWMVYGLPSLIMGLLLTRQKGYYELQKWGFLSAALLIGLYMGMLYLGTGESLGGQLQTEVNEYIQQNINLDNNEMGRFYEQQGMSQEEIKQDVDQISSWFVKHLPAFLLLETMLVIQLVLYLGAYISRKKNLPILAHRPFREEIMPWQLAWIAIIGLGLWLWGSNEMSAAYYTGSNLLLVMGVISEYYGWAGIAYRWHQLPASSRGWALPLFILISLMLFLPVVFFVALLGLFDSLLDYRNLYRKKEGTR